MNSVHCGMEVALWNFVNRFSYNFQNGQDLREKSYIDLQVELSEQKRKLADKQKSFKGSGHSKSWLAEDTRTKDEEEIDAFGLYVDASQSQLTQKKVWIFNLNYNAFITVRLSAHQNNKIISIVISIKLNESWDIFCMIRMKHRVWMTGNFLHGFRFRLFKGMLNPFLVKKTWVSFNSIQIIYDN